MLRVLNVCRKRAHVIENGRTGFGEACAQYHWPEPADMLDLPSAPILMRQEMVPVLPW